jgi:hypothetical protein
MPAALFKILYRNPLRAPFPTAASILQGNASRACTASPIAWRRGFRAQRCRRLPGSWSDMRLSAASAGRLLLETPDARRHPCTCAARESAGRALSGKHPRRRELEEIGLSTASGARPCRIATGALKWATKSA